MGTTTACTVCGAPTRLIVDPRIRAQRLICERRDCLRVEPVPAQWEVESAGGVRLPGFGGTE